MDNRIAEVIWWIGDGEIMSNIDLYAEKIDELGLPQFVTIPNYVDDDDIATHISDEFGYCIYEIRMDDE